MKKYTRFFRLLLAAAFLAIPLEATAQLSGLVCTATGGSGLVPAGTDLIKIIVDTSEFPDAVCNDESPAVFFARAGSGTGANRWIIYLPGGGSCTDDDSCAKRWCKVDTNFSSDKMSSLTMPSGIVGQGIFQSGAPNNAFGNWNVAYVHHCSSDGFAGSNGSLPFTTTEAIKAEPAGYSYTIHFQGSRIVEAVVRTLRRDVPPVVYDDEGGVTVTMPDLDDAEVVLLAGSGMGSQGVGHNADRVGQHLCDNHVSYDSGTESCDDLDFRAVFDAGVTPSTETLDYPGLFGTTYMQTVLDRWDVPNGYMLPIWGARVDQSCVDFHGGSEGRCADPLHVLHNHIETPFFAREDMQDSNGLPWKFGSNLDFAVLTHHGLSRLAYLDHLAEEGSYRSGNPPLTKPGVFGPQCGDHVALRDGGPFARVKITIPGRGSFSFHDVLVNWLDGTVPRGVLVDVPTAPGNLSGCP